MNDIYIIGASGFGREVAWLLEELKEWRIKGFIDDNEEIIGKTVNDHEVLGNIDWLIQKKQAMNVAIAIANPGIRMKIYERMKRNNKIMFPNVIAKNVRISKTISLGQGNIICTNNVLTTNITIGSFNHINWNCTIGHDVKMNDFNTIYPAVNVSGNVCIDSYVELGTGSRIIQGKKITDNVIVGAGGVVVKDILVPGTYVGVPAKRIDK